MFWFISQFPEFDHLDPAQRALALANVPWWTYPLIAARALFCGVVLAAVVIFVCMRLQLPPHETLISALAAICVVAPVVYLLEIAGVRKSIRGAISQGLAGQRPPFCFSCGFDLRQSPGEVCPECGEKVQILGR